jgi:sugar lactone lactonase YvrE
MTLLPRFARRSLPVTLLAVCGALGASGTASADYDFVTKWGGSGSGDGQFHAPYGIATDPGGDVYVTDFGNGMGNNDRVEKFSPNGTYITQWGGLGAGDTQFHDPWGIATDSTGHVFVADTANDCIKEFSLAGVFIAKFGKGGTGDGEFSGPWGLALNSAGDLYATDYDFGETVNRVQRFKTSIGGYVFDEKWGVTGTEAGEFRQPGDIAVDPAGNVYVSERVNHRVQKFDSDGFPVTQWGGMGSGNGQFAFPEGIATDSAGNVYVADRGNNRIQKFTSDGAFLAKWGGTGAGDGQFLQPNDVAVDAVGNVYVADTGNDRIQKFSETGGSSGSGSAGGASGGGGGAGKGAPIVDVSNELQIKNTTVLSKDGRLKFVLDLPAPGIVEATATVKAPPRPPSLDPDQRQHEGHKSTISRARKKKPIVVASGRATAAVAGPLTLVVAPNAPGKKYLGWKQTLPVTVTITYTPSGGTANSLIRHAQLKLAKKKPSRQSRR